MSKVKNATKATIYVLGFCCAALLVAFFVGLSKVATEAALMLLAILGPIVVILLAIYLVYKYLESK